MILALAGGRPSSKIKGTSAFATQRLGGFSVTPKLAAHRNSQIEPFYVMELMRRSRQLEREGKSIVHMEVGEPDFPTPEPVIRSAEAFLKHGVVQYTTAIGSLELREAIARFYRAKYRVSLSVDQVIITTGGSSALTLVLAALVDPGSEWLMADPGYPCNRHIIRTLGGVDISIPVDSTSQFQPQIAQIEKAWTAKTRGMILVSPNNPTGSVVSQSRLLEYSDFVRQKSGALIVDEVYHGLTYGTNASTIAGLGEHTFVVQSFSKYFNMTGWRLGWLIVPPGYTSIFEKLAQNLFIAPPTVSQAAAMAAFSDETLEILEKRRSEFEKRRDYLYDALTKLGFQIPFQPEGAFYIWADCQKFSHDSFHLSLDLLEKAGVAITPGKDFGRNQPERFLRFAYTTNLDSLKEGISRLKHAL